MVQFDGISVTEKTSKDHPLATYSAQYWSMHARIAVLAVQFDSTLEKQIDQLFASSTKLLTWIRLLKSLIAQGGNVEIEGGYRNRPLAAACRRGFASTAGILLDAGANFMSGKDDTVTIEATTSGKVEVVQLLLARERAAAEISESMSWPICHIKALNVACMLGFTDIIEEFGVKNDGIDVNDMTADDCRQVLQIAAAHGRSETVEQLFDLGANIDTEGGWYGTALRAASLNGHESAVKILLKKGADPKLYGGSPGSALGAAIFFDRTFIFDLILQDGRIDVNNNEGMYGSLLQEAASERSLEFVRKLLDKGAKVNAEEKIVELLLERGARPNDPEEGPADVVCVTPNNGIGHDIILLPFEKAGLKPYEWNGADFVRIDKQLISERLSEVIRTQPSVTIQKGICGSALRAAAIAGDGYIVKCLLNAGATFDEHDPALQSVLKRASSSDDQEIELVMKILANKKSTNSKTGYRTVETGQTRAEDYVEGDRSDSVHGSLLEIGSFEKHPRMWVKLCF
ncbi:putative multiple ankyrin repeats single kh domain protein [Botrytis cinerea BcDW1]|uniref:Putative multiple ankyrin repeats single kh domain protein n=1 Tax=Botryotinia fuckeliana (strain BcDW1) TaxID=1290391 RepID=M7UL04_BOTF1|nr:putative multiple ankyrin repeats single kh domain protein [Botrytis cinerea BcDW1]